MAMVRCRECGREVSSEAAVCPHCGVRDPAGAVAVHAAHTADPRHGTDRVHGVPVHDGRDHVPVHHDRDHVPVRRKGGRAGWIVALLLLLVLAALFGLWYGNVVDFN
jgi:hypothetical protein